MPSFDMIFVGGVVLAFASQIAASAYGVRQTWDLTLIPDAARAALPQEAAKPVAIAAKTPPSVTA